MKIRSLYSVLVALIAIGSVLCQNAEELPIPVETDNQFPPDHSESDGQSEGSESTAVEPAESSVGSGSTNSDISPTIPKDDEQVIDDSEIPAAETSPTTLEQGKSDEASSTSTTQDDQKGNSEVGSEIAGAEPSQTDTVAESPEPQPETTLADEAVPAIENNDEQVAKNEDSENTAAEATQTPSESALEVANHEEQDTNDEEAIETAAAESTVADIVEPTLTNKHERDTSETDSETVPEQPAEEISGSTTVDISAPLLESDSEHDSEGSETTTAKPTQIASDEADQALTTVNDQDVTTQGSETTVLESSKTTESTDIVIDAPEIEGTESPCPEPCICITEGDSSNYIVDCSGHDLTELPTPIDAKTNTLKLQNNQLTTIPQAISQLKNLKNLYANDNQISELESGSVSELPELVSLNLANNNLQEYPKDLENASNMDKLEELDLSGNELQLTPEIFLNLKALRTVTLPEVSSALVSNLCTLKESLATVCTKSCSEQSVECSEIHKQHSLDATIPGMIPFLSSIDKEKNVENVDNTLANSEISETQNSDSKPEVPETTANTETKETPVIASRIDTSTTSGEKEVPLEPPVPEKPSEIIDEPKETPNIVPLPETPSTSGAQEVPLEPSTPEKPSDTKENLPVDDFSLRNAVNNAPQGNVAIHSTVIETPKESPKSNNETDVKVGAKTTETKGGGGVDKSVIAIIVAGMVIIIAVITIKKNWSRIRNRCSSNRCSSSMRTNERSGRNTNGTAVPPEEVPLQDKSPA